MGKVSRRGLLVGAGSALTTQLLSEPASATIARSLSLPALVRSSGRIVVITALDADSHFEELGRRRRVVTDTRVRIEESLVKADSVESELMVRTLGGSIGRLGELVHGQARLAIGQQCVAFLLKGPDGLHYVNGMAQGHYPLSSEKIRLLLMSPDMPKIVDYQSSAVKELVGTELGRAAARIRALSGK